MNIGPDLGKNILHFLSDFFDTWLPEGKKGLVFLFFFILWSPCPKVNNSYPPIIIYDQLITSSGSTMHGKRSQRQNQTICDKMVKIYGMNLSKFKY